MREPWRNTYAHLMAEMGWAEFETNFDRLELFAYLARKPRATLDAMLRSESLAPRASSCGRLFDAVAAAVGICREQASYEGQAACLLEAAVAPETLHRESDELAYPFTVPRLGGKGLPYIEPLGAWRALLGDQVLGTDVGVIAARFHKGLARAITRRVVREPVAAGDQPQLGAPGLGEERHLQLQPRVPAAELQRHFGLDQPFRRHRHRGFDLGTKRNRDRLGGLSIDLQELRPGLVEAAAAGKHHQGEDHRRKPPSGR
jgi:hypothetical protein